MIRGEAVERVAALARIAGIPAIDITELVISVVIGDTFDVDEREPAVRAAARKITATLLDAGWTMPARGLDQTSDDTAE